MSGNSANEKTTTTKTTIKGLILEIIKFLSVMLIPTCCRWLCQPRCFIVVVILYSMLIINYKHCYAMDVYFPMSAIQLNLPINEKSQSIFSKIPIAQFQVLYTANNTAANDYVYSLENNPLLEINGSTGVVSMKNDFPLEHVNKVNVVITAIPKNYNDNLNIAHVTLKLSQLDEQEYCRNLENICFWSAVQYTVVEDRQTIGNQSIYKPLVVGTMNPRGARYLCPSMDIKYKLENASDLFQLQNNTLLTRTPLDHESLNLADSATVSALVKCTVNKSKHAVSEFKRVFHIKLVDRNDNGPELQTNKTITFRLKDPHFKMNDNIGDKIIFTDKDSLEANAHMVYIIHNDTNEIIRPVCNGFETDHTGKRNTVVSCQLVFARNGILSENIYCFSLEARDETIENHISLKSVINHICLLSDTSKIHEADRPKAMPLRTQKDVKLDMESEETHLPNTQLFINTYPKDVYVNRSVMQFYRVVQPLDFNSLISKPKIRFRIAEDRSRAFGITAVAGIVYIKDVAALQQSLETVYFLNISWMDNYARSFVINVHLINNSLDPAHLICDVKMKRSSNTCAQMKSETQCKKFCGLGTAGSGCSWRGNNSAVLSQNYASCVPDLYCPDQRCDPLEELNSEACPQDCVESRNIMGPHVANKNKRGIHAASGTCICEDNGRCSCKPILDDDERNKAKRKRKNNAEQKVIKEEIQEVEMNKSTQEIVCGKSCIVIAASCPVVLILVLICLIISHRRLRKHAKGKQTLTQKIEGARGEILLECDALNGDMPLALFPLSEGIKFSINDLKWEFPRDKLVLDVVLGEGEFGKVMKAYATNIAGITGVTTVAVKMLKSGANSVEYAALLSEFQLLQEVSHPNVIKLLGACTKGDTPMIIIEYARYGSLRSYLRLSRKIECTGAEFSDGIEPVTVKDILSFTWQISKGMQYLTEIKLVHRDLAARNVLLAENKICKISDFGLTRDVYEDDAYLKRSRDRVPVKWMAPESLADHVYTTKTDVWAFGVLCWEIINLGTTPYPGVPPQNLYHLLKSGYRMERPEHCSEEIYSIIRSCWASDPNARPSFKYLASELEKLLGSNAKYLELESHAISNPTYCLEKDHLTAASETDLTKLVNNEPECLDHLWQPPKYSTCSEIDGSNSRDFSMGFSGSDFVPPGYDMPRPLIEASTTSQTLRYENDLRFPLNIPKTENCLNPKEVYSVPVKRGRSYMDMTNKTLIPDNLDNKEFEKNISKTISFRFSNTSSLKAQSQDECV